MSQKKNQRSVLASLMHLSWASVIEDNKNPLDIKALPMLPIIGTSLPRNKPTIFYTGVGLLAYVWVLVITSLGANALDGALGQPASSPLQTAHRTDETQRASPALSDRLLGALEAGRFDTILTLVNRPGLSIDQPGVDSLKADLQRHRLHQKQWQATRQSQYDFAISQLEALTNENHLEDALTFAIEAHSLTQHKDALLNSGQIQQLTQQATVLATQKAAAGSWIDAISLYRRLDLLYDNPAGIHHANLKQAARHLRILQFYAPEKLESLYQQRAYDLGEEAAPRSKDQDTWSDRVRNITSDMMIHSIALAKDEHIAQPTYKKMLLGSVEALLAFVTTQGLGQTFPALEDQTQYRAFFKFLNGKQNQIAEHKGQFTRFEMSRLLNKILQKNRATLKLPNQVLIYELTQGAMAQLDDFTSVIWPYDYEQFTRHTRGTFYGVGIKITLTPGPITIDQLVADDLAYQAGLRNGDKIIQIAGRPISGHTIAYVHWRLAHLPPGGFDMTVERGQNRQEHQIHLVRPIKKRLQLKRPPGRLMVQSPLRGTPAYKANIVADDLIVQVDGHDTANWSLNQAVRKITGPLDTTVTLGIMRKGDHAISEVPIQRAQIEIESIKGWRLKPDNTWDHYIDRQSKIGYIRLSQFIPQSAPDMDLAYQQMIQGHGLNALILDLRFNPGGRLSSALEIVNRFVRQGTIITTVDAHGSVGTHPKARPDRTYQNIPLVVLINQGSASASEIVAGALQDYGRATIVGTRSFGKGSVQEPKFIDTANAFLKLTIQYYRLPNKRIIHRKPTDKTWGIEPDLVVEMTTDQVRESIQRRQELDVLQNHPQPQSENAPLPSDTDTPRNPGHARRAHHAKWLTDPNQILTRGLDPQLASALLVLKTRLIVPAIGLAQTKSPPNTP